LLDRLLVWSLHEIGSMRIALLVAALAAACMTGEDPQGDVDPTDLEEVEWTPAGGKGDFSGVPVAFNRNTIMSDAVLLAANAVDARAIQAFLEDSPYGTRSWLADHLIGTKRFSDVLVEEARAGGIDPVVLLARMQVENSLVSKTVKPSNAAINHALGCGCPDSRACSRAYAGLQSQLRCAIEVLDEQLGASRDGTGRWRLGVARRTLDPLSVTPTNHATAALYAYTPWVLSGRGGNWLVWNVTRKYLKHFDEAGTLHLP
jgi:hypothetical protein